ncbi:spore coat protein [Pelotomaculum isophthalicicum JI]|uniref:Spore coat protein n=1 Tax=Pelotomaculum isophthalicicum JI TaxID=947010 RepID=A0A9X4H2K2_9FIRM|nr:spore coat protein [Pelotomaculum isophthalicicum]MDF9408461.1 spore coat protein [Pelotomaculum isophthalicicum JI]
MMSQPRKGDDLLVNLDDRDMITDVLFMQKQLIDTYMTTERESANSHLREALHDFHQEEENLHAKIFHSMHQRGWYKTPVAGQQAIENAIISWEQKLVRQPELRA